MPGSLTQGVFKQFCCVFIFVFFVGPAAAREHDGLGDHHDSPVYFELYKDLYFEYENMASFRGNRLKVLNFPEVDVTDFDWKSGGIEDDSWWSGAQRLTYLLPFIDSDQEMDRALAEKWFVSWYDCQKQGTKSNPRAWSDPFVVAYRTMVLVFFLKTEEVKANPNDELIAKLRLSIFDHQAYLADGKNFNADSNHGLVEAIALVEVTRAAPNSELMVLAMRRVLSIVSVSVSDLGCHMEHAPAYHFSFLRWVNEIHDYCITIRSIPSQFLQRLADHREQMQWAAYFLHDHRCYLPQIGDSDSVVVGVSYPGRCVNEPDHDATTLYDPDAGYAIYKGHPSTKDRRYVVFTNQNKRPKLRYHYHDDALSVFYSYDGEVILGDQGKYEYTYSEPRQFFASPAAHNTLFSELFLTRRKGRYIFTLASAPACVEDSEAVRFSAQIKPSNNVVITRSVVVHREKETLCVFDSIWSPGAKQSRSAVSRAGDTRSGPDNRIVRRPHTGGRRLAMVWNFGRDVTAIRSRPADGDGSLVLTLDTRAGRSFRLSIDFGGEFEASSQETKLVRGNLSPMLGWYSPEMLTMRPVPTLTITFVPTGTMTIATTVEIVAGESSSEKILFRGD